MRLDITDIIFHAGFPDRHQEFHKLRLLTFRGHFDTPVPKVPDKSCDGKTAGEPPRGKTESHALDIAGKKNLHAFHDLLPGNGKRGTGNDLLDVSRYPFPEQLITNMITHDSESDRNIE